MAEHNKPILTGWLTKQGGSRGGRKNWKTRFFVLSQKHLLYFKNDKSRNRPLGEFTCDDLTAVAVANAPGTKDGFLFDLIYPTRTVRVTTGSESDRKNWIDAINQPSEYSGPGVGKAERPSRNFLNRRAGHQRAKSEGARARTRTMPLNRVATGGTAPCSACGKTAYPMESIVCDGTTYHKKCFRCKECNGKLTVGGYAMIHGDAYCKPHFKQLFQSSGGKYDRAFGSIYENSSDPLAKVIVKSNTEAARRSNDSDDLPPVAEFSDGEDSLSEGEMESMHRIEERKSRNDNKPEVVKSAASSPPVSQDAAKEKTFKEEKLIDKCGCGAGRVMSDDLTKKPAPFCYHCGEKFADATV